MKHLLAITIALLPTAALAEQFTPQQLIEVMTKSPSNRGMRVHDEEDHVQVEVLWGTPEIDFETMRVPLWRGIP